MPLSISKGRTATRDAVGWVGRCCRPGVLPEQAAHRSGHDKRRAGDEGGNSICACARGAAGLAPTDRSNGNTLSSWVPVRTNCASPLANSSSFASVSSKALIQLRDASS